MTKIQIAERTTATQLFFLRGVFSNFYPASFVYKGVTFSNSEQAFMWEKSRHFGDTVSCTAILNTTDPVKAKALGRAVKGYNDKEWDKVRYGYMLEVNHAKYGQSEKLSKILKDTKDLELIETNPRDKVWAIALPANDDRVLDRTKWQGQNLLGKVLMEVRDYLNSRG